MQTCEYSKISSNSTGMNVTLRDLLDQPIHTKTVKVIEVFINEGDYVYNCYSALNVQNQGELLELYNRWPGQIEEVYIKQNDLIGIDSVLYNIRSDFRQDLQVELIQYGVSNKRTQNIRINIIKNKEEQIAEQVENIPLDPKIIIGHKENVFKVEMNDGRVNDINFLVMKNQYPHLVVQYLEKL
ncbi:unnamed protein product (macronuclear) [Paramecium tetraurelia]|uniref:Uncharacterized protein n=1 Tax=Paramecium tetraurelia TaxID=5888 RepID=A0C8L3_PARTE|nr:uncharacterized protein GSPATT00036264001 [Paramecium tetraurelia]CAK67130.1 unnamed protein product [Paramecium tetraurelia]|eukprot:XP_001434527.1 hypothetical protein (macronuclear) [Paramecium tetraurelia strain d4-2]